MTIKNLGLCTFWLVEVVISCNRSHIADYKGSSQLYPVSLHSHYGVLNPECVGQGQHRVIGYNARQSWPLLHADVHRTP